jgi:hypothetical protein
VSPRQAVVVGEAPHRFALASARTRIVIHCLTPFVKP